MSRACCIRLAGLLSFLEQPTRVGQSTFETFLKNGNFFRLPACQFRIWKRFPRTPSKEGLCLRQIEICFLLYMAQTLDGGGKV